MTDTLPPYKPGGYLTRPVPCTPYLQQGDLIVAIPNYPPTAPWAEAPNITTKQAMHQTLGAWEGACNNLVVAIAHPAFNRHRLRQ